MRARDLLLERRDAYVTLPRRPLNEDEIDALVDFQEVLRLISSFYASKRDRNGFSTLKTELRRYHNRPFMRRVTDWITKVDAHHESIDQSKTAAPQMTQHIDAVLTHGIAAAKNQNIAAFLSIARHAIQITDTLDKAFADPARYYDNVKFSPLYVQDPLFFQSSNFLRRFETDEMEHVISLDPHAVFTYMDAPFDDNFQYFAYWTMELSQKAEAASLTPVQYNKWVRIQYRDDPAFKRMLKLVEDYLSSNQRHHLGEIIRTMKNFPLLMRTHEEIIRHVSRVYRGVPLNGSMTSDEILEEDRERGFVATSEHKHVATNFAQSKGHLERYGRTDGVVITYGVTPQDIALDTSVFGSIFGEAEIVINARTAKVLGSHTTHAERQDDW